MKQVPVAMMSDAEVGFLQLNRTKKTMGELSKEFFQL